MAKLKNIHLPVIGWREWVALPELGIETIKVKVDSGARSSSLHAFDVDTFDRDGNQWVRFKVHPLQRSQEKNIVVEAKILEFRSVKSSSGVAKMRPVIMVEIEFLDERWPVELTLASRDNMGFRMLLGREAFRGRFLVDAGNSYYGGRPERKKMAKKNNLKKDSIKIDSEFQK
ncbi:MAG: RimK/LysX family protein [Desulforhopalus sp.]|nr:RimK/LysX family protein [Desulforhopalus sp.]